MLNTFVKIHVEVVEVKLLYIGAAGALGSIARYLVSSLAVTWWGTSFGFGTLIVNVVGSFLVGLIMQIGLGTDLISPTTRLVLTVGILGGFTTYSSFNYETVSYFQEGELAKAFMNVCVMLLLCFLAGILGVMLGELFIKNWRILDL